MTLKHLFVSGGLEHGSIRRIRNVTALQSLLYVESTYGDGSGFGANPPEKTVVGSGYFAFRSGGLGLMALDDASSAHVFALAADKWIFWCGRIAITDFGSAPDQNDEYIFVRCAESKIAGANPYLGVGITIGTDIPSLGYAFDIKKMNANGTYNSTLGGDSLRKTVGDTVHWFALALDTSTDTNNLTLYIGGVAGATVSIDPATIEITGHMLHDDAYVAGKVGDSVMYPVHDDHCSAQGDSVSDLPSVNFRQILYQPTGVVGGEDDFTGNHMDVDDENDDNVGDGDTDANVITPTGIGDQQTFTFPNLVSEGGQTATVEAVLLVWEQDIPDVDETPPPAFLSHKPMARISGGNLQDLSGDYGSGADLEESGDLSLAWFACLMHETPEDTPRAWTAGATPAELFNKLEAGLEAIDGTKTVGEFYAIPIGEYIARPTATAAPSVTHIRQGVALGSANPMAF